MTHKKQHKFNLNSRVGRVYSAILKLNVDKVTNIALLLRTVNVDGELKLNAMDIRKCLSYLVHLGMMEKIKGHDKGYRKLPLPSHIVLVQHAKFTKRQARRSDAGTTRQPVFVDDHAVKTTSSMVDDVNRIVGELVDLRERISKLDEFAQSLKQLDIPNDS